MAELASRPRLVASIVACASFMQNLDSTIVATSLPQIALSFHTSPILLSVAITAYILSLAVFIPISGWLADRFGESVIFRIAILIFVVGSILCGISNNVAELAASRILQGIGGAMMVPVGRLVVLRSVPKADYVRALSMLQIPAQIGPLLGPPVGGFITTYASWRWIFLINVPIGILGAVLATLFIENRREGKTQPLDWGGFALTGISLSCLMYGLEALSRRTTSLDAVIGLFAVGVVGGWLSIRHARRCSHPLLDLTLLRIPSFRINLTAGSLYRIGIDGLPFLLPLLFQVVLGMTAFSSGLLIFAGAAGSLTMRAMVAPILRRFGFRFALITNGCISVVTILSCALFTASMPALLMLVLLLIGGFFRSFQFIGLSTLAYAEIDSRKMSTATSMASMAQQLCNGFGVAIAALTLNAVLALRGGTQLAIGDFQITFVIATLFALSSIPVLLTLAPDVGAELSGFRPKIAENVE
jgi:EmrB/QacA subfamily drug resistance transporter